MKNKNTTINMNSNRIIQQMVHWTNISLSGGVQRLISVIPFLAVSMFCQVGFSAGGTQGSGGGGAWFCKETNLKGKTREVTYLLDLWEAETNPEPTEKLNIPRSKLSAWEQFDLAVAKLKPYDPGLPKELRTIAENLFGPRANRFSSTETRRGIAPPDDARNKYEKKDCKLVGMMFYNGKTRKLDIDTDYFNILNDNTEIAASMLHEAWYYLVREKAIERLPVTTSEKSRELVGCVFASDSEKCLPSLDIDRNVYPASEGPVLTCRGKFFDGQFNDRIFFNGQRSRTSFLISKYYGEKIVPVDISPLYSSEGLYARTVLQKFELNVLMNQPIFKEVKADEYSGKIVSVQVFAKSDQNNGPQIDEMFCSND